ncbi:MAG: tRNA (adenosine(37)-N6)-threonylcarbamoyltransferase complex ATPase subunit type 1 TsaE [Acidimicrobiia bacterium]|nr:tRNA (adenosine(37)-N6)-threonylcarbamoyltransferase complex ATPase subunit type 1 TsaE [Acidimicrobiia bacterium]
MFAKGLARGLGVSETVVSPTFTIVREYEGRLGLTHVDVYRLDHLQELHDLGFDELVGGERVVLVEWGDVVASLLPGDRLDVRLDPAGPDRPRDERVVRLVARGSWRAREQALTEVLARARAHGTRAGSG